MGKTKHVCVRSVAQRLTVSLVRIVVVNDA